MLYFTYIWFILYCIYIILYCTYIGSILYCTYIGFIPHAIGVAVISSVATAVVSKPAVKVAVGVVVIEPIEPCFLGILEVLVGCLPHMRVAQQVREPHPPPLGVDLLLQVVAVPQPPAFVDGDI